MVYPKGANNMAVSGFGCRKALVGIGRDIFGIKGPRTSHLTCSRPGRHFQRDLTESLLIGGCGQYPLICASPCLYLTP